MNDILKEKIGIRYVIGALIAAVVMTVSVISFMEIRTVARAEYEPVRAIVYETQKDMMSMKVMLAKQQVIQENFLVAMETLNRAIEKLDNSCQKKQH